MGPTRELAEFVARTRFEDLPSDVVHAAKRCVLNAVGVALHAAADPSLRFLLDTFEEEGGHARAPVWGSSARVTTLQAALANGYLVHLDDFDDTHFPTVLHPSAPTVPAALALAEISGRSGRDLIAAVALGIEVSCRIALAVHPWHYDAGWHITGTAGAFGAAAAAGKLLGLDGAALAACFGIAGTQAAGVREVFGTMSKPLHAGRAAQAGVLAAQLAARGFSAPHTILEGRRGFGAVLSGTHDFSRATAGLGERWEIHNNGLKPYACGVVTHPVIDACRALRAEPGVSPESIAAIDARVHPLVLELTNRREIATGLEGKFSVQHCVAAGLVDGAAGPAQFTEAKAADPVLAGLRRKVSLTPDESLAEEAATVRLTLTDGRTYERHVGHATGSPINPLTDGDVTAKFRTLARLVLDERRVESLLADLWRLETLDRTPDLSV